MKKIKLNVSSFLSRLCTAAIAVLGYSCSSETIDMYGTPTGSFQVKGTVTDEVGYPVDKATIKCMRTWYTSDDISFAHTKPDAFGRYDTGHQGYYSDDSLKIVCVPDKSDLMPDTVKVKLYYEHDSKHDKMHKDDFMYKGHADVTANFKLKKKQ